MTAALTARGGPSNDFRERFRRALGVIRRGKGLIAAVLVLVLVPTILFLQQATPRYTASVSVLIEAPQAGDSLLDRTDVARTRLNEPIITTEAEVLSSSSLARRVIDKLNLDRDPEFNQALRQPTLWERVAASINPVNWLPDSWRAGRRDENDLSAETKEQLQRARVTATFQAHMNVKPERRSFVIGVDFTAVGREKAALIANTIANLYVLDRLEADFDETKRVNDWLSQRLEFLRGDVATAEAVAETYRSQHRLRSTGERQGTVTGQQLTELNSRLVLARADLAQKQARLDQIRSLSHGRLGGGIATSSDVLQSPLIQQLRQREAQAQSDLSEAEKTYGDRHPKIIGMKADLAEFQSTINQEVGKIATAASNDVAIAAIGVKTLEEQIGALQQQSDVQGSAQVKLRELERQAETSRSLYESLLARFKHDAEQQEIRRANARVLSAAQIPAAPSYPRKFQVLLAATVIGLALGIGLVFLLYRLDGTIHSLEEIESLFNLAGLAVIPVLRDRQAKAPTKANDLSLRSRAPIIHSFRGLRTALSFHGEDDNRRIVMVASSVPKEGKSFVSLGLARICARAGETVLLIDADLHRPTLATTIGIDGRLGLCQILREEADFDTVVTRPPGLDLDFLPAGDAHGEDEFFNGPAIGTLLAAAVTKYDRIIIDTSPVLATTDARILAGFVDHVIYLVKWNATQGAEARNGLKLLREVQAPIAGVVLSQVDMRRHATYGYGDYGYYYGRYQGYYGE